jgi:predicted RNA binding protein YcfA (HicA-like mRNA interferase family)
MRLPRDLGGDELAGLVTKYGYHVIRQTGSHLRLTSALKGTEHFITIPRHRPLKVGTLNSILKDVAAYVEMDKQRLIEDLLKG